jgi:hypothetical protein
MLHDVNFDIVTRRNRSGEHCSGEWLWILSPWLAFAALIIWDTREKGTWRTKLKDPLSLFTALLVLATVALVWVAALQWETLEKTDKTVRSGQRGFAYVKSVWWRPYIRNDKLVWWGLLEWENSGNTPIQPVFIELNCPSVEGGGELVGDPYAILRLPSVAARTSHISVQIGPKQTKFGGQCEFSVEDFQRIQNKLKTQYVIGQARYVDIYGESHTTRFCERIYLIKGNLSIAETSMEVASIPCVRHNCSDEECAREDAEPNLLPERLSAKRSG